METKSKPRIEVMLDLETTGIQENAGIMEIALFPFCLDGKETGEEPFHEVIDLTSCWMEGMKFCEDTQRWWTNQEAKAKWNMRNAEKMDIRSAIRESHSWLKGLCSKYEVHLWCRGLNFDVPKYERCVRMMLEERTPYDWWNLEDARTYAHTFDVHNADIEFEGIRHTAAADCQHQIRIVQEANRRKRSMRYYAAKAIIGEYKDDRSKFLQIWKETFGESLTEEEVESILN